MFLVSEQFEDPEDPSEEPEVTDIEMDHFCQILIGGDQVTAARVSAETLIMVECDWRHLFLLWKTGTQKCVLCR